MLGITTARVIASPGLAHTGGHGTEPLPYAFDGV
jgi:hypothetical protein